MGKHKNSSERSQSNSEKNQNYQIEKIVDIRKRKGRAEYKILWKGYPPQDFTWQPKENLENCKQDLRDFHRMLKQKKIKKAEKSRKECKINNIISPQIIEISSPQQSKSNSGKNSMNMREEKIGNESQSQNQYQRQNKQSQSQSQRQNIRLKGKNQELKEQNKKKEQYQSKCQFNQTKADSAALTKKNYSKRQTVDRAVSTDVWFRVTKVEIIQVLRCERRGDHLVFQVALKEGGKRKMEWMRHQVLKQLDKDKLLQFFEKNIVCPVY